MSVEELLYSHLTGHSGLVAVVGNRIYPMALPQEPTLPAVRYQLISREELHVPLLLVNRRYQLDGYAMSYAEAKLIESVLRAALYSFNRAVAGCILSTFIDSIRDDYDPELSEFGISVDAIITCSE